MEQEVATQSPALRCAALDWSEMETWVCGMLLVQAGAEQEDPVAGKRSEMVEPIHPIQ